MSIDPLLKRRERGIAYVGAIAAAVFATAGASAQVTQPTDAGVMSFPNVRVVTTTPTGVQTSTATSAAVGLRAFIDPETGQLTENPTAAHLQDLDGPQQRADRKERPAGHGVATDRPGHRDHARRLPHALSPWQGTGRRVSSSRPACRATTLRSASSRGKARCRRIPTRRMRRETSNERQTERTLDAARPGRRRRHCGVRVGALRGHDRHPERQRAGVGFNDPTPAVPVGGNAGTTLGQQRLNAFQSAANIWGATLDELGADRGGGLVRSPDLYCDGCGPGLRGGHTAYGPTSPAPLCPTPGFRRPSPIRSSASDLDPTPEIRARFNVNLGQPGCLDGRPFYLGLDNNHGTLSTSSPCSCTSSGMASGSRTSRAGRPARSSPASRRSGTSSCSTTRRASTGSR